jgi:hypothetical protein
MADAPTNPAPKARPLDYAPPVPLVDRVRRYLPSRDQFTGFMKNLVWVVPITLLIWVYAEREQSVVEPSIVASIDVKTADSSRVVTLRGPADKNIILELSGPRARLERVKELLRPKSDGPALQIDVDLLMPATPNQHIPTVAQINNNPIFKNNGITVKSAQPPYLVVDIDSFEEEVVPVRAPPEIAQLLGEQSHFDPSTIKIRAPSKVLERAAADKQLFVYADLSKHDEIKTRTGPYTIDNVPVYWPGPPTPGQSATARKENVYLTPPTVKALLEIKQRDVEYTIPRITVSKATPARFEDGFTVDFAAQILNVPVTGPAEQIDLLRNRKFIPEAVFKITGMEKTGELQAPLKIDLPPGVQLTKESRELTEKFSFTIKPRPQ